MVVLRKALMKLSADVGSGFYKFGEKAAAPAPTEPRSRTSPGALPTSEGDMELQDAIRVLQSNIATPECAGVCESQMSD